jgi:hypothetical protein
MRRKMMVFAAALFAVLMTAAVAMASSVHLKNNRNPSFTDNGLTLTAAGALSGLGSGNIAVKLTATANTTATCTNPSGANKPPGRNPAPTTVSGGEFIPSSSVDKNGNVPFTVTTNAPSPNPITGAPDCPGSSWTETITDLAFTSATIQVFQPANADGTDGTLVLTVNCTFSSPTTDGSVPSGNVTCA